MMINSEDAKESNLFDQSKIMIKRICIFYKFMQQLCEGHCLELQNYVRAQNPSKGNFENSRNIDFIQEGIETFKSFTKYCNNESILIGITILNFLIESVMGPCRGNQESMIKNNVIDSCKDLLNDFGRADKESLRVRGFGQNDPEVKEMVNILLSNVVSLLRSVMEGNSNLELLQQMGEEIQFTPIMARITNIYIETLKKKLNISHKTLTEIGPQEIIWRVKESVWCNDIQEAFSLFLFLRQVNEATGSYQSEIYSLSGLAKDSYTFFYQNSATIEVIFQGKITKIYFMKHPACNYLSDSAKEEVMNSVRRDNPNEKIADFMNSTLSLFNQMDYTLKLRKKLKINPEYIPKFRFFSLLVCYVLNGYLMYTSHFKINSMEFEDDDSAYSETLVFSLVLTNIFVISILLVLRIITKQKLERVNRWSDYFFQIKNIKTVTTTEKEWLQGILAKDIFDFKMKDYLMLIKFKREKEGLRTPIPRLIKLANDIKFIDNQTYTLMFFIISYASGLITQDKWFYCFPLLDTLNLSETLKILITAVTFNGTQILLAVILVSIVVFIFSLYAYYYVLDTFWNDSFDGGENQCTSVRHCFFTIFSLVGFDHLGPQVFWFRGRRLDSAVLPRWEQGEVLLEVLVRHSDIHPCEYDRHECYLRDHYTDVCSVKGEAECED